MHTPWIEPVLLICRSGKLQVIATTEDAYTCLTTDWPVSEGTAFLAALDICNGVSEAGLNRDLARLAFIKAAHEASLSIESVGVAKSPLSAKEENITRGVEEDR